MALIPRSFRRQASALVVAGLVGLLTASSAFASTPVTVGFRDQAYGGGAARPSGDKPQSKLWYTDDTWYAGMFRFNVAPSPNAEYEIFRLDENTDSWVPVGTQVDIRDTSHADYLWDEGSQTLYVVSVPPIPDQSIPAVTADDGIKVFKYSYDAGTNAYTAAAGFPKEIANTASVADVSYGGAPTVTIALDTTGDLWAAWPRDTQVKYSTSGDGGETWSAPAQVPAQAANSINDGPQNDAHDSAAVIAFGSKVGIMWSDQDNLPASTDNGFYFGVIDAGADPTVAGNWTLEDLPTLASPGQVADNHINIKTTSDGSVYMVGKTGKDTTLCASNKDSPLIEFFDRTPAGEWDVHLVGTVGDCNTRPQVVISEELDSAYVFLTSPNGGGIVYRKAAPLSGPDAFVFRGEADQTLQPGTPFIQSATDTLIDDPSTTKQVVTSTSGIVVLANNLTSSTSANEKFYLHNEMDLPATDSTDPVGTATINAGAAATTTVAVSVAVPATDAGSGVSLVRLSNVATVDGDGVLSGAGSTTFVYNTPIAWMLSAGDGTKTVYAQWRDSAGNWSTPVNDTIVLDATAPTGTVVINGGDTETETTAVTLGLTRNDGSGSGVVSVLISNSTDFTGVTPTTYADTLPWTLAAGGGTKTVYVKFTDAAGNTSASPVSDTIVLDAVAPTGTVVINGGDAETGTAAVTLGLTNSGGVVSVLISNSTDFTGVTPTAYAATLPWTLAPGAGTKTVYVKFTDGFGNTSAPVSDTIVRTGMPFTDVTSFAESIEWLYFEGITGGCSPTKYCPKDPVTRAQMAMFLDRAMDLPSASTDYFDDDDGKTGEASINSLALAGITGGCGPRRFCPTNPVTRAQMAMFLDRALDLPSAAPGVDYFDDDDGKTGEASINALAESGITGGCGPRRFCPSAAVTRGQMAAFLFRAFAD